MFLLRWMRGFGDWQNNSRSGLRSVEMCLILKWIMFSTPQAWKSYLVSFSLAWVYVVTEPVEWLLVLCLSGNHSENWWWFSSMGQVFFQNWAQHNSKLTLTVFDLTWPTTDDCSNCPQGADFSASRPTRTGSILNQGVVESFAVPNLWCRWSPWGASYTWLKLTCHPMPSWGCTFE